jgi:biofilm PGA synthesis N-glycosyltransferase PgaC
LVVLLFSIFISLAYVWWARLVFGGWNEFASMNPSVTAEQDKISIVIAFRNESKNLPILLDSLSKLEYQQRNVEIIFVDDKSEDDGPDVINSWIQTTRLKARLLSSADSGKKAAQNLGIEAAQFSIVACTDADCELPCTWLKRINEAFINPKTELVFGSVELKGSNNNLQRMEFLALIGSTVGMLQQGWAVMGNAANMAFRKATYMAAFASLDAKKSVSGDDVFLLHEVAKKPNAVNVLPGADSVVKTFPQSSFNALLSQRIRWASKAKLYVSRKAIAVAFLVFLANTLLLCLLFGMFFQITYAISFIPLVFVKLTSDYVLLKAFSKYYKHEFSLKIFLLQEVLNLIYIPSVAILSQLQGFKWKGRKY